jgi:hypothetical protein
VGLEGDGDRCHRLGGTVPRAEGRRISPCRHLETHWRGAGTPESPRVRVSRG